MNCLPIAILKAVNDLPQTGYDFTKYIKGQKIWRASHQQVYRELNKMEASGLVSHSLIENMGKPDAKVYSITAKGTVVLNQDVPYKLSRVASADIVMQVAGNVAYLREAKATLLSEVEALKTSMHQMSDKWLSARLEYELAIRTAELNFVTLALNEEVGYAE
ncbi:PadR family transcriptional regulator [Vibrio scophthalmi]|uniref:Transcription regulator PadR N-terminal domain-containing protein n=1 Tax=Vibrio scophthalmi TaxID=45658 RepID=A0A1E3WIZ1_9VIBR|nr:PadR family transcriptional regulator [Vibrio scophthalmi]ODS09749.1 hypothetical protein VSF3289_03211 [Vibrio scophthalmi]